MLINKFKLFILAFLIINISFADETKNLDLEIELLKKDLEILKNKFDYQSLQLAQALNPKQKKIISEAEELKYKFSFTPLLTFYESGINLELKTSENLGFEVKYVRFDSSNDLMVYSGVGNGFGLGSKIYLNGFQNDSAFFHFTIDRVILDYRIDSYGYDYYNDYYSENRNGRATKVRLSLGVAYQWIWENIFLTLELAKLYEDLDVQTHKNIDNEDIYDDFLTYTLNFDIGVAF